MKFEGQFVEVDGITYRVDGEYNHATGDVMPFSVYTAQDISTHLMDSVVEDIMTEIILRYDRTDA